MHDSISSEKRAGAKPSAAAATKLMFRNPVLMIVMIGSRALVINLRMRVTREGGKQERGGFGENMVVWI